MGVGVRSAAVGGDIFKGGVVRDVGDLSREAGTVVGGGAGLRVEDFGSWPMWLLY